MVFVTSGIVSLHPKALLVILFSNIYLIVIEIQTSNANLKQIRHYSSSISYEENLHHLNQSCAVQYDHWSDQNH